MVYTERTEMAADSCGTSHASAVIHHFGGYSKTCYKKLFTHVESHASAVSLLESGEQRYIKAINQSINQTITIFVWHLILQVIKKDVTWKPCTISTMLANQIL